MSQAPPKQVGTQRISAEHLTPTVSALHIAMVDGSGNQITAFSGAGTQYTEGDVDATITGTAIVFEADSTTNTLQTVNSTRGLPVAIVSGSAAGSTLVSISQLLDSSGGSVTAADSANQAIRVNVVAGAAGGSTIVTVSSLPMVSTSAPAATSSGLNTWIVGGNRLNIGSTAADNAVSAAQSGAWTVTATIGTQLQSTVVTNSNSSALNVRVIGGVSSGVDFPVRALLSSTGTDNPVSAAQSGTWTVNFGAQLISTAVANTNSSALNVRVVGHGSSAVDFPVRAVLSSTGTDNPVSAAQSGTWTVNLGAQFISSGVANSNSSAINVRIVGGVSSAVDFPVRMLLSSTKADNLVSVYQSTRTELLATVYQSSASEFLVTNTIGTNLQSTTTQNSNSSGLNVRIIDGCSSAANFKVLATIDTALQSTLAGSSNSSALLVRPIIDNILTTASTSAFAASTSFSIQSSGAALRSYVTAYSILSTNAGPHKIKFYSSGTMFWPVILAAVSSAVSGVNLAVSAPAYIFRTNASEALTLQLGSGASTIAGYQVAVSYFRAL